MWPIRVVAVSVSRWSIFESQNIRCIDHFACVAAIRLFLMGTVADVYDLHRREHPLRSFRSLDCTAGGSSAFTPIVIDDGSSDVSMDSGNETGCVGE